MSLEIHTVLGREAALQREPGFFPVIGLEVFYKISVVGRVRKGREAFLPCYVSAGPVK